MKKFFYVAVAATALASCSSDQLVDLKEGDEIKLSVIADNDSRAETIFCNYNLPESFQLYAATVASTGKEAQDFIVDEKYVRTSGVTYERDGVNRYWPENDALNFYAVKNAEITWEAGEVPTGSFEVDDDVESQLDFVYAANPNQSKPTSGSAVALNFRHALSQIEFKVANANPDLEIIVKNVKVGNALSKGNFTFPATTAEEWENHNQGDEDMTDDGSVIAWASQNTPINFTLAEDFDDVAVLSTDPVTALTFETDDAENANFAEIYEKSMLLLPQLTTAWNGTEGGFLAVKCVINNIIKEGENITDRVVLYGDNDGDGEAEGRWAFVPVKFDWKPGYKYVYTFNFTNGGNAGYDDSNGNDKPGNVAVLLPLTVDVTVDDFQPTNGSTEDMATVE